jgi:sec-independent protein translocase protein TatC
MTDTANPGIDEPVEMEDESEQTEERSRMGFLDHLDELRKRILYSVYAIVAGCIGPFIFWEELFTYTARYFNQYGATLIYTSPMGAFMFSLQICLLLGLIIASPFVFSQMWLFVAPGLYAKEKRVVVPFVLFSTILFGAGAAFSHLVAFPSMWRFFASYNGIGGLQFFPTIDETFGLYVKVTLGLGLVFQMPLLVYFLSKFGIVTWRFLAKQFRYALLIIVILAAIITPSADIATQMVFAVPMLVLYVISIGVAWVFGKKKKPPTE